MKNTIKTKLRQENKVKVRKETGRNKSKAGKQLLS